MPATSGENRISDFLTFGSTSRAELLTKEVIDALEDRSETSKEARKISKEQHERQIGDQEILDLLRRQIGHEKGALQHFWNHVPTSYHDPYSVVQQYVPINLETSVGELKRDILEITKALRKIGETLDGMSAEIARIPHIERIIGALRSHIVDSEVNDNSWLAVAEPSFEFWDNEEDTIYDAL